MIKIGQFQPPPPNEDLLFHFSATSIFSDLNLSASQHTQEWTVGDEVKLGEETKSSISIAWNLESERKKRLVRKGGE